MDSFRIMLAVCCVVFCVVVVVGLEGLSPTHPHGRTYGLHPKRYPKQHQTSENSRLWGGMRGVKPWPVVERAQRDPYNGGFKYLGVAVNDEYEFLPAGSMGWGHDAEETRQTVTEIEEGRVTPSGDSSDMHRQEEEEEEEEEDALSRKPHKKRDRISKYKMDKKKTMVIYVKDYWKAMENHHSTAFHKHNLHFLSEKQWQVDISSTQLTYLVPYSLEHPMEAFLLHAHFYFYVKPMNRHKERQVFDLREQQKEEERGSLLRVLLSPRGVLVQCRLKGQTRNESLSVSLALLRWHHMRIVALQTKVVVTVAPLGGDKHRVIIPFSGSPALFYSGMALNIGGFGFYGRVKGLVVNNLLVDLSKISHKQDGVRLRLLNPFEAQQVVYFSGEDTFYKLPCKNPYGFDVIKRLRIDLPRWRQREAQPKAHMLVFAPMTEQTGWVVDMVPVKDTRMSHPRFCHDWVNKRHCIKSKVKIPDAHDVVLEFRWTPYKKEFSMKALDLTKGLHHLHVAHYGGPPPRCVSELFIGGVNDRWFDALTKSPLHHFRGMLSRISINSQNIQLNAITPQPFMEQDLATHLSRVGKIRHVSSLLPRSPVFVVIPVWGEVNQTLACWYDSLEHASPPLDKMTTYWIDMDGTYIEEGKESINGKNTKLKIHSSRVDNLYTCVVRAEGVADLVPATFAVFRVNHTPVPVPPRTYAAHFRGTAVCTGHDVPYCEGPKLREPEEFIELGDAAKFIPAMLRALRTKWLEPTYSGDFQAMKLLLWVFLVAAFTTVFLFVAMPCNADGKGGATSYINQFLAKVVFRSSLLEAHQMLLKEEGKRPHPYRPKRSAYGIAEGEESFSAIKKLLLQECLLREPPSPKEDLVSYVLWESLVLGNLVGSDIQNIMFFFKTFYRRQQPTKVWGFTLARDEWLKQLFGKDAQLDTIELNKKYKQLKLDGHELLTGYQHGELQHHNKDLAVYYILRPILDELETIYRDCLVAVNNVHMERRLQHRVHTVQMALRVFHRYQQRLEAPPRPVYHQVPCFTKRKCLDHQQVAWVLLKHLNVIFFLFREADEKKKHRGILLVFHRLSVDLQELRLRRYKWFLRHERQRSEGKDDNTS